MNLKPISAAPRDSGLAPFIVKGALGDGTLPLDLLTRDLSVEIPRPERADPQYDKLQLIWDGAAVGVPVPVVAADMTQRLLLPQALLQVEGRHTLDYMMYHGIGGNPQLADQTQLVIVDLTAPGTDHLGALLFAPDHYHGVTEQNLVAGVLPAFVPGWLGQASGDVATLWVAMGRYPAQSDFVELAACETTVKTAGTRLVLDIPRHVLTALGDGCISFSYKVRDKAGNRRGNLAYSTSLKVLLDHAPEALRPPFVAAAVDGLITWADARQGVDVTIPRYDNASPADAISVAWGNEHSLYIPLAPEPVGGYPDPIMIVRVPRTLVQLQGNGTAAVAYTVLRDGVRFGPSHHIDVQVDLRTPGGVDPDPLTPEHDNLQNAQVFSRSGALNEIPESDYGHDAEILIPRLGKNGAVVWADGDELEIVWAGITVGRRIAGDSADIRFVIDHASVIEQAPAGEIDVSYRIKRPLGNGHFGVAQSAVIPVRVIHAAALPGGRSGVPLAVYPEAFQSSVHLVINKAAGIDGTYIRVPLVHPGTAATPLENVASGDQLSVRFVAVNHRTDPSAQEIAATEVRMTHTLEAGDLAAGYWDGYVSEDQLKAICYLTANAYITLTNAVGAATSPRSSVIISVRTEGYCTIPTP